MKAILRFLALLVCGALTLHGVNAAKPDESLRALVRNSTLIIDADVVQPNRYGSINEFITSYSARVRVREVLFGEAPTGEVWVRVSGQPFEHSPPRLASAAVSVVFFSFDRTTRAGLLSWAQFIYVQRSVTVPS